MKMKFTSTLTLLALLCGCSTTATISRINGGRFDAKIKRGSENAIIVQTEEGREVSVQRSEITDIDHPGNVAAVIGGLVSAYGALNIGLGASKCGELGGAYCTGVFLPAAVGIPILIWGVTTWMGSTGAASASASSHAGVVPTPPTPAPFDFSPPTDGGKASALSVR